MLDALVHNKNFGKPLVVNKLSQQSVAQAMILLA
jgi:hypothetical protein